MPKKGSETTSTNWVSPEDQARIRQGRQYGDAASQAAMGIQEAGVNPLSTGAAGQYADIYNRYGQMGQYGQNYGQQALDFAGQTGLQGFDQYFNPYADAQINPMRDMFDRMRADEYSGAGSQATQAGAFGGSRHAKLAAMRLGGVDRTQAGAEADIYSRAGQQAMQAMMGERARMGQLGQYGMGMGLNALSGQGAMAGNIANMGDYFRQIQQLQNERGAKNAQMASAAQQASYGKDIESGTTDKTEQGWMEGILPAAMQIGSMFIPGAQMAAPLMGGMMGSMFGGNEAAAGNFGGQYADPWQGMNVGQGAPGATTPSLFSPAPYGGYFGGQNYGGGS